MFYTLRKKHSIFYFLFLKTQPGNKYPILAALFLVFLNLTLLLAGGYLAGFFLIIQRPVFRRSAVIIIKLIIFLEASNKHII